MVLTPSPIGSFNYVGYGDLMARRDDRNRRLKVQPTPLTHPDFRCWGDGARDSGANQYDDAYVIAIRTKHHQAFEYSVSAGSHKYHASRL